MLDKYRYRRLTAAMAEVCGLTAGETLFVGCPVLARLVAQHPLPGFQVAGEVAPQAVQDEAYRARTAQTVVALGEVGALPAVAMPLAAGGQLLWFSTLAPEVAAARALCAGLGDIKQRPAGRYLLTVGTRHLVL